MPKIEDTIEVQVPVEQAYNQWTQFEDFPKFMEGIQSVQQLDDTHVQGAGRLGGSHGLLEWAPQIFDGPLPSPTRRARAAARRDPR